MTLHAVGEPLREERREPAEPRGREVRIRVGACAVCRTDLHVVDGELPDVRPPIVPGHEVVGTVEAAGPDSELAVGARVGVPWLAWTCGACAACRRGQENLCDRARFTGYTVDGGFAETMLADSGYCVPLPADGDDVALAPLLCAGLIGWRTLRAAGDDARTVGIYGFGAAAHIVAQVLRHQGRPFVAFTRPGDEAAQAFARSLGADAALGSDEPPPAALDAALIFAPVGDLVPTALRAVRPGGTVVCGGIHMSDIPSFPYELLWSERRLVSVANLTREDGREFMRVVADAPVETSTTVFPLAAANDALDALRAGRLSGAAVLRP